MKYVYLIRDANGFYKIGISDNMRHRISQLNGSHPHSLIIVAAKLVKNAVELENDLHEKYFQFRTKAHTDWYQLTPEQALDICVQINNAEEDEYRFTVKDIEEITQVLLVRNKDIQDEIALLKELRLSIKRNNELKEEIVQKKIIQQETRPLKKDDEDIYEQAKETIFQERKASASLLQRKLQIGYSRAARILDRLEADGLVTHQIGSSARDILESGWSSKTTEITN